MLPLHSERIQKLTYVFSSFAGVAQLVRALPCHGRGCGFKSRLSRSNKNRRENTRRFLLYSATILDPYPDMILFRDMNRKKYLPIALLAGVAFIIAAIVWQVMGGKSLFPERWTGVEGEPVDVTLGFVEAWLGARAVGDNEPFTQNILDYEQVSPDLRKKLKEFDGKLGGGAEDPVLCQTAVPEGLRTLPIYKQDEAAQVLVMSTTEGQTGQAIFTLAAKNNVWRITDITCGNAEQAPKGEFSFDRTGFLLKQVPAPLDSKYWHLVFEEAGVLGHAVPLFIDESTVCTKQDGSTGACNDDVLKETAPARVMGELGETGVVVKRIEMVESVSIQ